MFIADTHAWIWWMDDPRRLSRKAFQALEQEEEIGVSAISCWELAMLVAKARLQLDRDPLLWIKQALALPKITLLPLNPEVAVLSASLEELSGDPADRIIVASALVHDAPLVTKDGGLRKFKKIETIW